MALSPLRAAQELPSYPDRIALLEGLLAQALADIASLYDLIGGGGLPTPDNTLVGSNTVTISQIAAGFSAGVASLNAALAGANP